MESGDEDAVIDGFLARCGSVIRAEPKRFFIGDDDEEIAKRPVEPPSLWRVGSFGVVAHLNGTSRPPAKDLMYLVSRAVFNNMGHIHSHFFDKQSIHRAASRGYIPS